MKLDAIDPITLALQGCTEFNEYCSLENYSNYLQVYIADQLVMLNLNGEEIQAIKELDNLEAYTDADNFIDTCFKPRYGAKRLAQSRLRNLVCITDDSSQRLFGKCCHVDVEAFNEIWKEEDD